MTSKLTRQTTDAGKLEKFPVFPPRDDMQNSLHLDRPAHQSALYRHFGGSDTVIVLSEIPVRWSPPQQEGHRIPDLLIAFGVDFPLGIDQRGYSIRDQGKPPDFVLEIASPTTGREDYTGKRSDYANFRHSRILAIRPVGRPLSRRPDGRRPAGWRRLPTRRTAGDRPGPPPRAQRRAQPGPVLGERSAEVVGPGGRRRYLLTFDETDEARIAEAEARATAEARADSAEARADREREARTEAEARIRELEAELERRTGA